MRTIVLPAFLRLGLSLGLAAACAAPPAARTSLAVRDAAAPLAAAPAPALAPAPAAASPVQYPGATDDDWSFAIAAYLWASGLDADVQIDNLPEAELDVDVGDVIDEFDFPVMLGLELGRANERWALLLDTFFLDLEDDDGSVELEVEQTMLELAVAYRPSDLNAIELLFGLRYWDVGVEAEVLVFDLDGDEEWVDPIAGARWILDLAESLQLTLRGDVGGFGVGSDMSWQALGMFGFRLGERAALEFGWRHLDVDFDDDDLEYDAELSGPLVGLRFGF
jgi:hypothetical protein